MAARYAGGPQPTLTATGGRARKFWLFVTSAVDQLTAEPGGCRTLFILDEFAALKSLDAISKAFGYAAGYNVQLWLFLQDLPQLKTIYPERWETFVANAGLLQFFTPADMTGVVALGVGVVFENEGYVADQPPGIGGGVAFPFAGGKAKVFAKKHLRLFEGPAGLQPVADLPLPGREGAVVHGS